MTPVLGTLALLTAHAAPLDPTTFDSIAPLLDPDDTVFIDTDGDVPMLQYGQTVLEGKRDSTGTLAVFTFDEVVLDEDVLVGGDRPVVILSKGDLTLSATLVVSADGYLGGPGGGDGGLDLGEDGGGDGGGTGNNGGGGGGGFGGPGGASESGTPGGATFGNLRSELLGGSGGGRSSGGIFTAVGGGGGGAVELGAVGALFIEASAEIVARGGNGGAGSDGAGGGSGGGVFLHGSGGTCEGTISANGGDGSDGSCWPLYCPGGGGGGGGQVVIDGLRSNGCVVDVSGGGPFSDDPKVIDPRTGGEGLVDVALDPDFDGDGWSVGEGDCNDTNAGINPGAEERICNQVDEDCNEATPDQPDADGDGAIACNECDDADPLRFPGNPEVLCDGIDNDCNDETADDPGDCDRIGTGQTPDSPRGDGSTNEELSTGCSCSSGPSGAALPALGWLALLAFRRRRQ